MPGAPGIDDTTADVGEIEMPSAVALVGVTTALRLRIVRPAVGVRTGTPERDAGSAGEATGRSRGPIREDGTVAVASEFGVGAVRTALICGTAR